MQKKYVFENLVFEVRDVLPLGTFCPLGHVVLRAFCPWDVLSLGTFCPWVIMSEDVLSWDVLSSQGHLSWITIICNTDDLFDNDDDNVIEGRNYISNYIIVMLAAV